jgi:hypothetical protein
MRFRLLYNRERVSGRLRGDGMKVWIVAKLVEEIEHEHRCVERGFSRGFDRGRVFAPFSASYVLPWATQTILKSVDHYGTI